MRLAAGLFMMSAVPTVYTMGHSNHGLERFLAMLAQHAICALVDVRTAPYSKHSPHFCKDALARAVRAAGIEYFFLGDRVGGRPEGAEYYDARGNPDYARRARAADFLEGIEQLAGLAGTQPTAIVCAEENPERCHRRQLITPALMERKIDVIHIRGDGRMESERALRAAVRQLSLFS